MKCALILYDFRVLKLQNKGPHCSSKTLIYLFFQLIPFEVLQMSERILSLDLADLENENGNPTLKSEDEITLCKKILLFCASICKGPVY